MPRVFLMEVAVLIYDDWRLQGKWYSGSYRASGILDHYRASGILDLIGQVVFWIL